MSGENMDAALAELEALAAEVKETPPTEEKKEAAGETKGEVPYNPDDEEPYYPGDADSVQPPMGAAQTYRGEDGIMYYWDAAQRLWLPQVDESLLEQQQAAYGGTPSEQPAKPKKRKKNKPKTNVTDTPQVNPSDLYVEGLPIDATVDEVASFFSKTGIVRKDPLTGELKIKLYKDAEGRAKGDATICYFKKESVDLALSLLDGAEFRPNCPIKLSVAQYVSKPGAAKKKQRSKKIRMIDQAQDLAWEEAENLNVIIKHMFEPKEAWDDPKFFEDLKVDLNEECAKFGPVAKIVLFEHNPEGVVAVKFKSGDAAKRCIEKMNGRFFASKQLTAEPYDGRSNYHVEESEESKAARIAKWEQWLDEDDGNKTTTS